MTNLEQMVQAYLAAVYFTETGDRDQPDSNAELTEGFKAQAHTDCARFLRTIGPVPGHGPAEGYDDLDMHKLGHDLWLTRNGHGSGFWDCPQIYGNKNSELFTRLSRAMGEVVAEFVEESK